MKLFLHVHFSVEMWSRFLLSGCGPAQERKGDKATRVQKTDPHTSGCGEHTRGTLVETCSISLGTFSCVFCSPTEHLGGEVQELWGVQGRRSAYSSQHSHSARRWVLYRSHQCDLWHNSSVNLTDSTFCQQSTAIRRKLRDFFTTTRATRSDWTNSWNFKLV